jgi:transposase-like protein
MGKRKDYTIEFKKQSLSKWAKAGWSTAEAAQILDVNRCTLLAWQNSRDILLADETSGKKKRRTGGGRLPETTGIESSIVTVVKDVHRTGKSPSCSREIT